MHARDLGRDKSVSRQYPHLFFNIVILPVVETLYFSVIISSIDFF